MGGLKQGLIPDIGSGGSWTWHSKGQTVHQDRVFTMHNAWVVKPNLSPLAHSTSLQWNTRTMLALRFASASSGHIWLAFLLQSYFTCQCLSFERQHGNKRSDCYRQEGRSARRQSCSRMPIVWMFNTHFSRRKFKVWCCPRQKKYLFLVVIKCYSLLYTYFFDCYSSFS